MLAYVSVGRSENIGVLIKAAYENYIYFGLGKSGNEIREMLVQVYGENALKKTAVYRWVKLFLSDKNVSLTKRDQDDQQQAELKKTLQTFVKLWVKIIV
jgi:hypothetical protein